MSYMVRSVAAVRAPAMAIVAWVIDSSDDRRERALLSELNRLRRQFEGPRSGSDSYLLHDRVPRTKQATAER